MSTALWGLAGLSRGILEEGPILVAAEVVQTPYFMHGETEAA